MVPQQVAGMSLNRSEQALLDYVQTHREERLYWEEKVRRVAAASVDAHEASVRLDGELRRYLQERARFIPSLGNGLDHAQLGKMSLRNLAEFWVRSWTRAPMRKAETDESAFRYGDL